MKKQTKIKHIWTVIADSYVVDQQTNNLSIHKVLEQLVVTLSPQDQKNWEENKVVLNKFPIIFSFEVISLWNKVSPDSNPTGVVEIELIDPAGLTMQKANFDLQFEEDKLRTRSIAHSPVINISTSGQYLFKISLKETGVEKFLGVAEIPLEVKIENSSM